MRFDVRYASKPRESFVYVKPHRQVVLAACVFFNAINGMYAVGGVLHATCRHFKLRNSHNGAQADCCAALLLTLAKARPSAALPPFPLPAPSRGTRHQRARVAFAGASPCAAVPHERR